MKVYVSIPIDLRLQSGGEFSISKQIPDPAGARWENIYSTQTVSGGEYLAELEAGHYLKTLQATNGISSFSTAFEITQDGKYIDEEGHIFKIAEDGKLTKQDEQ